MKKLLYSLLFASLTMSGAAAAYGAETGRTVILSEDFAKFTSGSFGAPDEYNDIAWAGISDYTQSPGWDGEALYAAGGSCYIGMAGFGFYPGMLTTPAFDGSANEGNYIVFFRACGTAADDVTVTHSSGSKQTVQVTTEWAEYSVPFTSGTDGDKITFSPMSSPLYIDDIVIYYELKGEEPEPAPAGAVLFETFDAFLEGSEADPVAFKDVDGEIPAEYTAAPGWKGKGLFQAGGSLYFGHYGDSDNTQQGYLNTPVIDLSANGGRYTVTFKAREYDFGFGFGYINVGVFDATTGKQVYNNYAEITSEWTDCSIDFTSGLQKCYLQFTSGLGEAYIDDIAVIQPVSEIEAPVATGWTDITATGFTVAWNAVEGADSYLLSVYQHDNTKRVYLHENVSVEGTSYTVEGADITKPYYYTVKAVLGDKVSNESNEMRVLGLIAPELLAATNITMDGFTANWNQSDRATTYLLTTYLTHKALEAEDYVLIDEDFSAYSGGSLTEPVESSLLNGTLDDKISRGGWSVGVLAYTDGAIALDNRTIAEYGTSWMHSPVLDMKGGACTLTLNHRGVNVKKFNVVVRNAGGEELYSKELYAVNDWYEDKVELPEVDGKCYISVEVPSSEKGLLYISDMKLTKRLEKDEELTLPYSAAEVSRPYAQDVTVVSKDVHIGEWQENDSFSYSVKSRRIYSDSYTIEYIFSCEPEAIEVKRPTSTGVADGTVSSGSVDVVDGAIVVEVDGDTAVEVFDIGGRTVYSGSGSAAVRPGAHGIYIVRFGNSVVKVAL